MPTAQSSACMVSVYDKLTCLVFGGAGIAGADGYAGGKGLHGFDETWLLKVSEEFADWTALEKSDPIVPPPRVAASLNKFPKEFGKFVLTGGWNPATAETFEEPWELTCRINIITVRVCVLLYVQSCDNNNKFSMIS